MVCRWIAAGTPLAWVVWDAKTYKQVWTEHDPYMTGVDFSTRLVSVSIRRPHSHLGHCSWQKSLLWNENGAREAKYSMQGDLQDTRPLPIVSPTGVLHSSMDLRDHTLEHELAVLLWLSGLSSSHRLPELSCSLVYKLIVVDSAD